MSERRVVITGLGALTPVGNNTEEFWSALKQGKSGIGQLLKKFAVQLQGEQLLAAVIMTSLLGVVVFWTFGLIQQRAIGKWYESTGVK